MAALPRLPQLHYFRDTLSYLSTLEKATVLLLLALLEMVWFYVAFEVLFCSGRHAGQCDTPLYQQVESAVKLPCASHDQRHSLVRS